MFFGYALHHEPHLTFGRETAQFQQFVGFMAAVSIVIWSIVVITLLARWWVCSTWRRSIFRIFQKSVSPD